eukprot:1138717-Pelagomonas_calceolata.AAC.3
MDCGKGSKPIKTCKGRAGQLAGTFYYSQASSDDAIDFLQKQTNETYRFVSELMDIFCAVGTVKQTEQPNYLAEGQTPL